MNIPKDLSPDVIDWAKDKLAKDREYFLHQSKFGSPINRAIAALVLEIGE